MSRAEHDGRHGQPIAYGLISAIVGGVILATAGWRTIAVLIAVAAVLTIAGAFFAGIADEWNRDDG